MNDMPAGVLGFDAPSMGAHSVALILQMGCPGATILTNGELEIQRRSEGAEQQLQIAKALGAHIDDREIERFVDLGERKGMEIHFRDGSDSARVGFLAHKPITRPNARHLAEGLSVEVVSDGIGGEMLQRSEPFGASNVEGVFVAGDAGVMVNAFVLAMGQGCCAGMGVVQSLLQGRLQGLGKS